MRHTHTERETEAGEGGGGRTTSASGGEVGGDEGGTRHIGIPGTTVPHVSIICHSHILPVGGVSLLLDVQGRLRVQCERVCIRSTRIHNKRSTIHVRQYTAGLVLLSIW